MFDDVRVEPERSHGRGASFLRRTGLTDISPAALTGVVVMLLVALLVAAWRAGGALFDGGAPQVAFESNLAEDVASHAHGEDDSSGVATPAADAQPESVWVHVAGAVNSPGLRELPVGSRVGDAVEAAGGPSPEASIDTINLAQIINDGEHVYVPTREQAAAGTVPSPVGTSSGATRGGSSAGQHVNINSAGESELEALPGVGPATAARIVADREANGPFSAPEDIMRVPGIGEKKLEAMRDFIVVR